MAMAIECVEQFFGITRAAKFLAAGTSRLKQATRHELKATGPDHD